MNTSMATNTIVDDLFSRDATGLPVATATPTVDLADGDTYALLAAPVRQQVGDTDVRLLAYNGSVPGPTLRVRQGSSVTFDFTNRTDLESTVHWHGLRLDNRFDGTHETQTPVPVGGTFAYRVRFPDPGVYWYHPHVREDYGQELGLYGNILVVPDAPDYWPPAHREVLLTLDDILIEDGKVAPFSRSETTYAAMGRYGNVLLVGGETTPMLDVRLGEVVRLYLTNTANTRVFNVALPGARMKLVGGDSGRVEREEFVDSVILAPSERAVVDVLFSRSGALTLEHRTPARTYPLATIEVGAEPAMPTLVEQFEALRHNPEWVAERERLASSFEAPPDKTLALVAELDLGTPEGPVVYACPMHPEITGEASDRCPKCGMTLLATAAPSSYVCPMHPDVVSDEPGRCPKCGMALLPAELVAQASGPGTPAHHGDADGHAHHAGHDGAGHDGGDVHAQHGNGHGQHHGAEHASMHHEPARQAEHGDMHAMPEHGDHEDHGHHAEHGQAHGHHGVADGIEWEDEMVDVNRMTTSGNTRWKLVDRATGAVNHEIDWVFRVGDRVKLRLVNETDSDHPMHHPFHIHGAGRFVVLTRDGAKEENLVWKDTVLVRTGQTVDLLLDVTNPGVWMAHCHIAEHHESGMMFSFRVVA
jgi:FtsP/CotA-like multicopper oxidase with cupredoxin domain